VHVVIGAADDLDVSPADERAEPLLSVRLRERDGVRHEVTGLARQHQPDRHTALRGDDGGAARTASEKRRSGPDAAAFELVAHFRGHARHLLGREARLQPGLSTI
jgi:hypothetical protein